MSVTPWTGESAPDLLKVFAAGDTIATHTVRAQRGAYVTDVAHCPPGMEDMNNLWSSEYFLTQASRVGPNSQKAIADLLASRPIIAQVYLPARNILAMAKATTNPSSRKPAAGWSTSPPVVGRSRTPR